MKLIKFSVTNYRSITKAHKIDVGNLTVLVGKNNEGKSNILRALALAMDTMVFFAENSRMFLTPYSFRRTGYHWEKDFPISLQDKKPNGNSIFDLLFELDEDELASIKRETSIRMGNTIPVRVSFGKNQVIIDVPKRGASSFREHKLDITRFVCNKIFFNFIPAIRTEHDAIKVINKIITAELTALEDDKVYTDAVDTVERLQQTILNKIAKRVKIPLNLFLPTVKDVSIQINKDHHRASLRRDICVIIDDGTATEIQYKGDGIKSLTALAMLNGESRPGTVSVVAIEEPESHLHPESIHKLVGTINTLSETNQVIITTHNPLFVYRNNPKANIIVNAGAARPAKSIKEIRDVLGILPSDNLINSQFVLVVEGDDDKISLRALLSQLSPTIMKALNENRLEIKALSGAGNLSYEVNTLKGWLCRYFVFLDNDDAGKKAAQQAKERGVLSDAEVKYTICNGQLQSEFEDCIDSGIYRQAIIDEFAVDIKCSKFRNHKKWSDRMRDVFLSSGQQWDDKMEKRVKQVVSKCVAENSTNALNPHKRGCIDALVSAVEGMIS